MKKILAVALMISSIGAFASPQMCLRNKLYNFFGVDWETSQAPSSLSNVRLGNMPNVKYSDYQQFMNHGYDFWDYKRNDKNDTRLYTAASKCHCNVHIRYYKNVPGQSSVEGWCWDM